MHGPNDIQAMQLGVCWARIKIRHDNNLIKMTSRHYLWQKRKIQTKNHSCSYVKLKTEVYKANLPTLKSFEWTKWTLAVEDSAKKVAKCFKKALFARHKAPSSGPSATLA